MFALTDSMRYWFYPYPTDMRKSFYTLAISEHPPPTISEKNRRKNGKKRLSKRHKNTQFR
jgi:hypothetical protein